MIEQNNFENELISPEAYFSSFSVKWMMPWEEVRLQISGHIFSPDILRISTILKTHCLVKLLDTQDKHF